MFLGEISKVKVKKPLLHANYCWALTSLRQENNLNNLGPTQPSMGLRRRASAASGSPGFTLKPRGTWTWPGLATMTPSQRQRDNDTRSSAGWRGSTLTPGYSAAPAAPAAAPSGASLLSDTLCGVGLHLPQPYGDREGGGNCSRHFIRTELRSREDLYTQQCKKKFDRIIRDPNRSRHQLFRKSEGT